MDETIEAVDLNLPPGTLLKMAKKLGLSKFSEADIKKKINVFLKKTNVKVRAKIDND